MEPIISFLVCLHDLIILESRKNQKIEPKPHNSKLRIDENAMHIFLHHIYHMNYETKLCINRLTNGLMTHIERGGDKLSLSHLFSFQSKIKV